MFLVSWKLIKPALLIPNVNLNFAYIIMLVNLLTSVQKFLKFCQRQREITFDADNLRQRNQNLCILEIAVRRCQWLECLFSHSWLGKKQRALDWNRTDDPIVLYGRLLSFSCEIADELRCTWFQKWRLSAFSARNYASHHEFEKKKTEILQKLC